MLFKIRDTYKYNFIVGRVIVHSGITRNIRLTEKILRNTNKVTHYYGQVLQWQHGRIEPIGKEMTHEQAKLWLIENDLASSENAFNENLPAQQDIN